MKHICQLSFAILALSGLGVEATAQERYYSRDGRYDESRPEYRRGDPIQSQVRELNNDLARVRSELRTYRAGRRTRADFAVIEQKVDQLNAQFRSGRYDRRYVSGQLAQLDDNLRVVSRDLRRRDDRSRYADRDDRSGYLEYHPTHLQRALAKHGYYRGPIDGQIGAGTNAAIIRFQTDRGLRATGRIDDELLRRLGIQ